MSKNTLQKKPADLVCRERYGFLIRKSRRDGLNAEQVERSAAELTYRDNNRYYLIEAAYKPTGVVLGCPLPDPRLTDRLRRLAGLLNQFITGLRRDIKKAFAFVPPDSYHITLVNHTHYDVDTTVKPMTAKEKSKAEQTVLHSGKGPVNLQLHGLIVTHWGRLIVPGYPNDGLLYRLRQQLAGEVPQLRANLPNTAHIKLGHVLAPLNREESRGLWECVTRCGEHIHEHVSFDHLYSPLGRIPLQK